MDIIMCQGYQCKKRGCSSCGGYGYVLKKNHCRCGQSYWSRPGVFTSYPGKEYSSYDGLKFKVQEDGKVRCKKCEYNEGKEWRLKAK